VYYVTLRAHLPEREEFSIETEVDCAAADKVLPNSEAERVPDDAAAPEKLEDAPVEDISGDP